jgi:hypothetical protein
VTAIGQGAAAAIFDVDRKVLLVKENYDRRPAGLPGDDAQGI